MPNRFDYATFHYWRIEFIDPLDPDDDRYVVLHGDEGEIVGPLTMALATTWIEEFHSALSRTTTP
jgi:hypothetical protein